MLYLRMKDIKRYNAWFASFVKGVTRYLGIRL